MYKRLITFIDDFDILSSMQYGFREKHNTTHALFTLIKKVAKAYDDSSHTIGIFMDFSKAFDTIDHTILLHKLYHYGIRGKALEWFRSYLTNRKQFVRIHNHKSCEKEVSCGVPQGSILGPLLFIIYVNDFYRSSQILTFILFSDDSNIFFSHQDPHQLVQIVNTELNNVAKWIRANRLSLNLDKTNFMLFSNTLHTIPGNIIMNDLAINKVESTKFVGVMIDDQLSWKTQTHYLCKKVSRNIGIITKLKHFFPWKTLHTLYCTLILSILNYGILAWGNSNRSNLNKIHLLQKRAMRIIFNKRYRAHTNLLFHQSKSLKINDLYSYNLGNFMYQLEINDLPIRLTEMFIKNQEIHNYPTRQSNHFHPPRTRTVTLQKTFIYTGPILWNSLNPALKSTPTLNTFKRKLKNFFLNTYDNHDT